MNTPFERALFYVDRFGWPVFPRPGGRYIGHGFKDASRDFDQIDKWWSQYPDALIAMPTGEASGIIVLDIDTKHGKNGYDTLTRLGRSQLPDVPMVHTPHDGLHLYFSVNQHLSISTAQNLFPDPHNPKKETGLDLLGENGNVPLPTPGWGYRWDPHNHPGTCAFLPAPSWFSHRRRRAQEHNGHHLDPTEILARACSNIRDAGAGSRHQVLNREAFIIGCVVARGALSESTARHELEAATIGIGDDKKSARDLADAFKAGLRKGNRR